jgi:lantibiotic modifying enzyme
VLWEDGALLDDAEACLARLPDLIAGDTETDLLDGAAGCIPPLLLLHNLRPGAGALDAARACGERVLARALPQERGIAWWIEGAGPAPLTGLSHGAAGISLALLHLAAVTGDERFREAARGGIEFERSRYSPEIRNWPDLRSDESFADAIHPDERAMCAWCHGAAGIGLSRLGALPLLDDPALRGEIAVAVEATLAQGLGFNHSLCHGDLGCLDFLHSAARALGDAALEEKVLRLAGGVLADIAAEGWRCGMPEGAEPPGLMVGLAGIGYGLLRLAAPDETPSVLLLEGIGAGFGTPAAL